MRSVRVPFQYRYRRRPCFEQSDPLNSSQISSKFLSNLLWTPHKFPLNFSQISFKFLTNYLFKIFLLSFLKKFLTSPLILFTKFFKFFLIFPQISLFLKNCNFNWRYVPKEEDGVWCSAGHGSRSVCRYQTKRNKMRSRKMEVPAELVFNGNFGLDVEGDDFSETRKTSARVCHSGHPKTTYLSKTVIFYGRVHICKKGACALRRRYRGWVATRR